MEKKTSRNSSIELLRIITMMGVVLLHYNNPASGGGFKYVPDGSINQYILVFTESLFICAVNLFIMISAYFLSCTQKRRMTKIFELIMQLIVFRVVLFAFEIIKGADFTWMGLIKAILPLSYFVMLYSALYIISPYINILINKLGEKNLKKLLLILFLLFSVYTYGVDILEAVFDESFKGLSTVSLDGSLSGYSIVNFVLVYFIGASIRVLNISMSKKKTGAGFLICLSAIFTLSAAKTMLSGVGYSTWNYNNPFIIAIAAFILLFFLNIDFKSKIVNELARGAFTCYLLHSFLLQYYGIEKAVTLNPLIMTLHLIGVAAVSYFISYVVYKLYYLCTHWFIKLISPLFEKINISPGEPFDKLNASGQ